MKLGIAGVLVAVLLAALVATMHPQTAEARVGKPTVALMANGDLRISWASDPNIQPDRYVVQIRSDVRPRPLVTRVTSDDSTNLVVSRNALKDRGNMKVRVGARITGSSGVTQWSRWSRSFVMADFATGLEVRRLASGNLSVKWNPVSGATQYVLEVVCITAGCTDNRTFKVLEPRSHYSFSTPTGVKYRVRVHVVKGSESGPWTDWMTEPPSPVLPAIANYEVHLLANGKIRLKWDLMPGAEWYEGQARCITDECVRGFRFKVQTTYLHTVQEWQPANGYRVRMRAANADGTSAWTNWKTATPVPQMPSISNLNVRRLVNGRLGIKWDPVAEAGWYEGQAECTTAKCTDKPVFRTFTSTAGPAGTEYSQRGPISEHLTDFFVPTTGLEGYRVRVRAVYAGDYGPWTDWVIETSMPTLADIDNLRVLRLVDGRINVKWDLVPGADSYHVELDCTSAGCTANQMHKVAAAESDINLPALAGQTYRVRVRASDSYGSRAWSDWEIETPLPILPVVDIPSAWWQKNGQLLVSWNGVKGATKYHVEVECGFAPGADPACVTDSWEVNAPQTRGYFTPRELLNGQMYQVRVRAADSHGARAWSFWMPGLPFPFLGKIANPKVLRLVDGQLRVEWDTMQRAEGYEVMIKCTTAKCTDHQTVKVRPPLTHAIVSTSGSTGYRVRVRATNRFDVGAWSDWVVEPPPAIASVYRPGLHLRSDQQSFNVRWRHVAGADYYIVEMACGVGIMIRAECISYRHEIKKVVSATLAAGTSLHLIALGPETMRGSEHNHLRVRARVRAADAHGVRPWSDWSLEYVPPPEYLN